MSSNIRPRPRHLVLATCCLLLVVQSLDARVVSGRITDWSGSDQIVAIGHSSDFVLAWWSINTFDRGWFYPESVWGAVRVALAEGVRDIRMVTNAASYQYANGGIGPFCDPSCDSRGVGQFVAWKNQTTGHYAVVRIDDIHTPGSELFESLLDVTWWFQTDGTPRFSGFPTTSLDVFPGRCPDAVASGWRGSVPIAIAGTSELDVRQIDVSTLRLQRQLSPDSWYYADAATRIPPSESPCNCVRRGGDGIEDLVVEYSNLSLVALLRPTEEIETFVIELEGTLLDATYFSASNCITFKDDPQPAGKRLHVVAHDSRILYELPGVVEVRLGVYDVAGRLVDQLVRAQQPAGAHVVAWDHRRHARGVYLYRLQAGDDIRTGKLLKLR